MRIDLSGGHWADLREVSEITERNRRPILTALGRVSRDGQDLVQAQAVVDACRKQLAEAQDPDVIEVARLTLIEATKAAEGLSFSEADLKTFLDVNDLCIVALVDAWSIEAPIVVDSLLDLKGPDYQRLLAACAPAVQSLYVDFAPTKPDTDSPTGPSSASAGVSREHPSTSGSPSTPSSEPTASSVSA